MGVLNVIVPVSLGIVAFPIPISQREKQRLREGQGLVHVHRASEWRG